MGGRCWSGRALDFRKCLGIRPMPTVRTVLTVSAQLCYRAIRQSVRLARQAKTEEISTMSNQLQAAEYRVSRTRSHYCHFVGGNGFGKLAFDLVHDGYHVNRRESNKVSFGMCLVSHGIRPALVRLTRSACPTVYKIREFISSGQYYCTVRAVRRGTLIKMHHHKSLG